MNTNTARRHLQKVGNVGPDLEFWRHMVNQNLENNLGLYHIDKRIIQNDYTITEVLPCEIVMAIVFSGRWLAGLKNSKSKSEIQ